MILAPPVKQLIPPANSGGASTKTHLEVTRQGGCGRPMVALNLKLTQPSDGDLPFCTESGRICEYRHARPRHNRGHHDRLD
jgi:hypothetical protein